ncbi:hypothetical protein Tco_1260750 [Tanacetum coccineum]
MASTRASISKVSKRPKINIIPPKQLFVDLTQDDTKTPSPKLPNSSPSAPNAPSKTPSTKDTSSSSIDYIPKSPTSSTSPSPNGYLNPSTSPPPRVSPPPPTQDNASMDITLTLSPNTPLDVQFDTPSPSPPIIAHPIPWNFLEAHAILSGADNRPPMLEKDMYDSWKSIMELYMMNRQHGRMILESVENGPLIWPSIEENGVTRPKKYSELTPTEAIQADCDVKATNIILQGLPPEVYALVINHKVAKELWERIQLLMQGTSLKKQERGCKLYDEFDKFAYKKGNNFMTST